MIVGVCQLTPQGHTTTTYIALTTLTPSALTTLARIVFTGPNQVIFRDKSSACSGYAQQRTIDILRNDFMIFSILVTWSTLIVPSMSAERHRSTSRRAIFNHSSFRVSGSGALSALALAMSVSTTSETRPGKKERKKREKNDRSEDGEGVGRTGGAPEHAI